MLLVIFASGYNQSISVFAVASLEQPGSGSSGYGWGSSCIVVLISRKTFSRKTGRLTSNLFNRALRKKAEDIYRSDLG